MAGGRATGGTWQGTEISSKWDWSMRLLVDDGRDLDYRSQRRYWVTGRLRAYKPPQYFTQRPRPTRPPTLSGTGMSTGQCAVKW